MARPLTLMLAGLALSGPLGIPVIGTANGADGRLDYVKVASATDGRCTAMVKREGQLYSFEVIGLEPNETFRMETSSAGEVINYWTRANPDGYYLMVLSPNVKGRASGIAHAGFTSSRCKIHVSFAWRED